MECIAVCVDKCDHAREQEKTSKGIGKKQRGVKNKEEQRVMKKKNKEKQGN